MIAFPSILLASCLAVNPALDHVTAGDLAPLFPGLETVPADTPLAPAPVPGVARVFRVAELEAFAASFHLSAPRGEICVQRMVAPPDPARLLAAMQKTLPAAQIEILDYSRHPIPEGEIEFPLSGLRDGPAGAYWSGNVRYAGNRLFSIWAKVAASVKVRRVVALSDLQPGSTITAGQVREELRAEFPAFGDFPESANQVAGETARVPIRAGSTIRAAQLEPPKLVLKGETVRVDVWSPAAHLKLEAQAEGSGALGQTIPLRNLTSQKRFLARVEGKGRVTVNDSGERNPNDN
jgi:flagella basal body P-ring formation protein FlgA